MKKKTEFKRIDPNQSIYQAWAGENLATEERRQTPALEYFSNQWTFSEVDQRINEYARAFKSLRNNPESSVTFCTPTLPATMIAFYALNKLGVRAQFISPEILASSLQNKLDETDTETLVVFDGFYKQTAKPITTATKLKNVVIDSLSNNVKDIPSITPDKLKEYLDADFSNKNLKKIKTMIGLTQILKRNKKEVFGYNEFLAQASHDNDYVESVFSPNDTSVILYTGGSTGTPKGVEKTNEQFINLANIHFLDPRAGFGSVAGIRNGLFIPPNHPTGFHMMVTPWVVGATQVLQPIYNKYTFPTDICNLKLEVTVAAPSHYATFLQTDLPDNSLSHFRLPFTGGEPVSYELAKGVNKVFERLGVQSPLIVGYGMSEVGPTTMFTIGDRSLVNKAGKPLPSVEARIVDENGKTLGTDQRGKLEIFAPLTKMKGYYSDPGLTKSFFTNDGYAKTGDVAVRDENGNYEILGRDTDSFVDHSGKKHYLFDLENFIYKDNAVMEAEASKLVLADGSEVPVVHIVLKSEYRGRERDVLARIMDECREKLSDSEAPKGVRFIKAFGTNPISTKRDIVALRSIRSGFYDISNDSIYRISFPEVGGTEVQPLTEQESIVTYPPFFLTGDAITKEEIS